MKHYHLEILGVALLVLFVFFAGCGKGPENETALNSIETNNAADAPQMAHKKRGHTKHIKKDNDTIIASLARIDLNKWQEIAKSLHLTLENAKKDFVNIESK